MRDVRVQKGIGRLVRDTQEQVATPSLKMEGQRSRKPRKCEEGRTMTGV